MIGNARPHAARLAFLAAALAAAACSTRGADQPAVAGAPLAVQVPSGTGPLPGILYRAPGPGTHPTLVWFHGFPGLPEPIPEAAATLRDAGLNVLYVHYSGSWGTAGQFGPRQALADAGAALAHVRAAPAGWHADPDRVIVGGDSFGSWVALQAAAADPAVSCVATALVFDLGRLGRDMAAVEEVRGGFGGMFQQVDEDAELGYTLDGGSEGLVAALVDGAAGNDLVAAAPALRGRPVLLIGAADDTLAPIDAHLDPVAEALQAAGAQVTRLVLEGGHELADADYAGHVADWIQHDCL